MPTTKGGIGVYRPITEITKDIKVLVDELEKAAAAQEAESDDESDDDSEEE